MQSHPSSFLPFSLKITKLLPFHSTPSPLPLSTSVTLDPYCAAALSNRTRAGCMNQGKESFGRPDYRTQRDAGPILRYRTRSSIRRATRAHTPWSSCTKRMSSTRVAIITPYSYR